MIRKTEPSAKPKPINAIRAKFKDPRALLSLTFLAATFGFSGAAHAADEINSGDTAWMIVATCLVLFMTIPGLSLFYAGLVRSKNVLSVLMQCFTITALASVLWMVFGYSLALSLPESQASESMNLATFVGASTMLF